MSLRDLSISDSLFQRAVEHLPGGVNSPVRAFKAVGGTPPFIQSGKGSRIKDADGNRYIDLVSSYGPLLFGHAPDFIVDAITAAAERGTTYGAPTALEVEMAELVCTLVPGLEMIRFVNSGSEATTSAVRLARGATGRQKIIKCSGCFHGSVDSLLVAGGSGVATLGIPDTAGVPLTVAADTIVVNYNDHEALRLAFEKFGGEIAAFIVEPIAANMGVVLPSAGYLELARELTDLNGSLLIFDEVISGFRVSPGGAQQLFGILPDLTCFGKIIGGGVPCGAYGGRKDLMQQLAPNGPVYQAGTLSGNPLAMAAGLAMLREIRRQSPGLYTRLDKLGAQLQAGLQSAFEEASVPVYIARAGSLLTPFFTGSPVTDYDSAKTSDTTRFKDFFHRLLEAGVYAPPSQYEAWFLSAAHTEEDVAEIIEGVRIALKDPVTV